MVFAYGDTQMQMAVPKLLSCDGDEEPVGDVQAG